MQITQMNTEFNLCDLRNPWLSRSALELEAGGELNLTFAEESAVRAGRNSEIRIEV
jgi:hypothetical protein